MKKNSLIVMVIAIVILVGAGAFYGGMRYTEAKSSSQLRQRFAGAGANFAGRNGQAGNSAVNGQIIAKDDKTLTVKSANGGSKIIFYSSSTTVGKFVDGSSADLNIGENVMANGTANSDGSVTAQTIQIRPQVPVATGTNVNTNVNKVQ